MVRADRIVGVILGWVSDGLRDRSIGCKMDGGGYLIVPADIPYGGRIRDVGDDQRASADKITMAEGKIVEGDRFISCVLEGLTGVTTLYSPRRQ